MPKLELISPGTPYGKKIIDNFGDETGRKIIDFLLEEGIGVNVPLKMS